MGFLIWGRDCKLGDGYEVQLRHVTPFECQPINVTKGDLVITHEVFACNLSDQALINFTHLGIYLADSCLRVLDHRIVFDKNQYYYVEIYVKTNYEECESCDSYPDNCPSYVNRINYGIEMQVVVLKDQLPPNKEDLEKLVKSVLKGDSELTVGQKQIDCRVLINHRETREMTLGELADFIKAFEQGQHQEYLCPVSVECKTIREMPALTIKNWDNFRYFLTHLYTCYRKIEIKSEQAGYPGTFTQNKRDQSIDDIESALKTAKEGFKKMDRNNMFEMYFVLKKLWIAYFDYLKYSIDNRRDIHEGDRLPGTYEEFKLFLRKLNTWTPFKEENKWIDERGAEKMSRFSLSTLFGTPKKVPKTQWTSVKYGSEWYATENAVLIVPSNMAKMGKKLKQTKLMKNFQIFENNLNTEPVLLLNYTINCLIGFVNMSGASGESNPVKLESLNTVCPRHCTEDIRIWICTACGRPVRLNTAQQLSFVCTCGSKVYKEDLLKCVNPEHEELLKIDLLPENLKRITNQLKRHQNRHEEEDNALIRNAVQTIIHSRDPEELTGVITQMSQLTVFDGDTNHLLSHYLE